MRRNAEALFFHPEFNEAGTHLGRLLFAETFVGGSIARVIGVALQFERRKLRVREQHGCDLLKQNVIGFRWGTRREH